jgi:hypothetical protein
MLPPKLLASLTRLEVDEVEAVRPCPNQRTDKNIRSTYLECEMRLHGLHVTECHLEPRCMTGCGIQIVPITDPATARIPWRQAKPVPSAGSRDISIATQYDLW